MKRSAPVNIKEGEKKQSLINGDYALKEYGLLIKFSKINFGLKRHGQRNGCSAVSEYEQSKRVQKALGCRLVSAVIHCTFCLLGTFALPVSLQQYSTVRDYVM